MTLKLSLMRWCATLVGAQMLCGVLWILGPLLLPLEPAPARLAGMMALLLAWAAGNLLLDWRRSRRELVLTSGVTGAAADEAAAVGARLSTALTRMRQAKGRRFLLYEQPWYAIIGPPGAGKTTALLNAGLTFPLAEELGPGAVAGVGGTRLCDWWFTADAVLIDTAGRYTTQDSDREVDRAGWNAFLEVLRRTRPKQPLNGVIVAIALSDVALSDVAADAPGLLQAHARAIRSRVDELQSRLGVRLPVYALFTKADLLVGFSEFFADLDRTGREQVWGVTLPLKAPMPAAALGPVQERLDRRALLRLDAEANADVRSVIAGFPAQLASLLPALHAFMAAAFGPGASGTAPLLRGAYLTSGTQEGTPVDRLIGAMSQAFGLDQRRAARLRPEAGRSYFLAALLRDVVFREAALVLHRPGAARRRLLLRAAGFAACGLALLAGAGLLWSQRRASLAATAHARDMLAGEGRLASPLPLDPVADADFAALRPWLDAAAAGAAAGAAPGAASFAPGFDQDAKLRAAGQVRYRNALAYGLFPRLLWRAETVMRGALGQGQALYEATRIYLMLGGAGPLDAALVQEWFARDWEASLPGDDAAKARAALDLHLAALLREPLPAIALHGPLVASARATIGQVPLAQRAYSRLKPLVAGKRPPVRPDEVLGPAGAKVFLRLSGRDLNDGIPGLFTAEGFRQDVLPALPRAAREAAAEGWVLGEPIAPDSPRLRTLEADIAGLYAAEYAAAWTALLADLDPAPLRSLTQAAQDLFILSAPQSPMRNMLAVAAEQLAPAAGAPPGPATAAVSVIDQQSQPLRLLFGKGSAAAIDQVLRPLGDLQQQLAKQAASATRPVALAVGVDPVAALRAEAIRQPQLLARWLVSLATAGAALRDGGMRGAMVSAWNVGGGPAALCPTVIANRYPFVPGAAADASLDDFTRLLGPGGAVDAFFNTQLKPYVDTAARPWKLKPAEGGMVPPVTPADLAQFQRAAAIRDLFFPAGSARPLVRFDVTPGVLDPMASSAVLTLEGTAITATRDAPARPAAVTWPGRAQAGGRTGLAMTSTDAAPLLTLSADGPWAVFRLMSRAKAAGTGDRVALSFGSDRQVRFDLRANPNPFAGTALTEFRCPTVQ